MLDTPSYVRRVSAARVDKWRLPVTIAILLLAALALAYWLTRQGAAVAMAAFAVTLIGIWIATRQLAFNALAGHIQETHRSLEAKVGQLEAAQEQVVQAERMDAAGKLAGSVAHDFNNLLSVIIGETDLALMFGTVNPQLRESFVSIRKAGEQAAGLTRQLLAFSRRQLIQPSIFDLNKMLKDESAMLRRSLAKDIELVTRTTADNASVLADKAQIEQVIRNLFVNACDAMSHGGKLVLETSVVTLDEAAAQIPPEVAPGEYVVLTITDTGDGMTDDVKAHIFEPFFTTKALGKGTGLGLATCFEIVKPTGGRLSVTSELGVGTVFKVFIPQVPDATPTVENGKKARLTGSEIILLTDDDDSVRQVAARILQGLGYRVLQAASGGEALRMLTATDLKIDLLLTDVVLPHIGGRELAERAQAARPGIRVLFASGYTNDVILQHRLINHDVALVQKPFTAELLGRKVREVLDAPARSLAG